MLGLERAVSGAEAGHAAPRLYSQPVIIDQSLLTGDSVKTLGKTREPPPHQPRELSLMVA